MNKVGSVNYLNIGSRIEKLGLAKIPPSTTLRNLLGCSVLSHSLTGVCGSLTPTQIALSGKFAYSETDIKSYPINACCSW
jgi:hypothetical protein